MNQCPCDGDFLLHSCRHFGSQDIAKVFHSQLSKEQLSACTHLFPAQTMKLSKMLHHLHRAHSVVDGGVITDKANLLTDTFWLVQDTVTRDESRSRSGFKNGTEDP